MAVFNIQEILATIPHRYPFLLLDRVEEFEPHKSITAIKNVTMNEPFFEGHFPGNPIMPGVLMLEAMAQALAMLALQTLKAENKFTGREILFYTGVDKARFRRQVVPGDTLVIQVDLIRTKGQILKAKATVKVDGQLACEAEIMAYHAAE